MTSKKVIEFFYDVVSPYSWLGFEVLCRYRNLWNIDVKLCPAFLGGVVTGAGNTPPFLNPTKLRYMRKELALLSEFSNVPLKFPSYLIDLTITKGSLNSLRFMTAVQVTEKWGDAKVEQLSRELWKRSWSKDEDITLPASLSEAALKAGLSESEIKEALELMTSKEIKEKLKSTTQKVLDYGAYGFPVIVCHINGNPKMFFGSDKFELIAHCIGEKWLGPQPEKAAVKL